MSVSAVPPAKLGDSERHLQATAANQTDAEETLSNFASLLDRTSLAPTWTSLPNVAQLFESIPTSATEESTQPPSIVRLRHGKQDSRVEITAVHAGAVLIGDVRPQELSRHSRGRKSKVLALASLVVIGTVVALGSRDYVLGQAKIYESMLLDAIAGLDDTPTPSGNVARDERIAQHPSDAGMAASSPPSTAVPPLTLMVGSPKLALAGVDRSEEQAVDASAPAAPVSAPAPAATAPADAGQSAVGISNVTQLTTKVETPLAPGPTSAPSKAGPPLIPDSTQPARVRVEQAVDGSAPAALVRAPAPTASAPPAVVATQSAVGVSNATPVATILDTSLARVRAVAPLRVKSQTAKPKPVRIISVRPDGTPISSAGSAGTARASNPDSDPEDKLDNKSSAGVPATPGVAAEMPNKPQKPAKRQKRERSEKLANAHKLNAADAAALPATSAESPAAEQGPANPPQGAHAGRL